MISMSENTPDLTAALQNLAGLHAAGQIMDALEKAVELTDRFPENGVVWHTLGVLHGEAGKYAGAIGSFQKALRYLPLHAAIYGDIARLQIMAGETDYAVDYLTSAYNLDPENGELTVLAHKLDMSLPAPPELVDAQTWQEIANLWGEEGIEAAAKRASHILTTFPGDFRLHYVLSVAGEQENRYEKIIDHLGTVCFHLPGSAILQKSLADFLWVLEKLRNVTDEFTLDYAGKAGQSRADQLAEADRLYQQAVSLDPGFAEAWLQFGNFAVWRGNLDQASVYYQTALRLRPDDATTRFNLAGALSDTGQAREAQRLCSEVIANDEDFYEAHILLGRLTGGKDVLSAGRLYRQSLVLQPTLATVLNISH
jgi:tetratricopeptide (TPR) repeat protein